MLSLIHIYLKVINQYDEGRRSEIAQAQSRYLQAQSTEANLEKILSINLSKLSKYTSKKLTEKDIVDPFNKQNSTQLDVYKRQPLNKAENVMQSMTCLRLWLNINPLIMRWIVRNKKPKKPLMPLLYYLKANTKKP